MITFADIEVKDVQLILAGLKKLPMELVEELHNKLLASANEQWIAKNKPVEGMQVNPEDITITKADESVTAE
jgi:hypothetical protein